MITEIWDDFDPEKIYLSGQCFRAKRFDEDGYRFMNGGHVLYIRKMPGNQYAVSCSEQDWRTIWFPYFDLGRNYRRIREACRGKNDLADRAMAFGRGIRILRQEPWETLVTFIISQRKNIPAISKAVEALSAAYGRRIVTEYETIFSFPTPDALSEATEDDLRNCSLGYRAPYVLDAAERVARGSLDLDLLASCSDEELIYALQTVHGVGKKVANCVALFAYARTSCVPVDVWIDRAIEEDCGGCSPFPLYSEDAGIIQQYVFFYERFKSAKA